MQEFYTVTFIKHNITYLNRVQAAPHEWCQLNPEQPTRLTAMLVAKQLRATILVPVQ
jgi:hypothetical protein